MDRRAERAQVPAAARRELTRRGEPLDPVTRTSMERRFGQDLSQVRVHSDGPAAKSARELGARAYTVGEQIVFGAGRFAPHTPDGRHLLAHELAHVIQQRGGAGPRPTRHAGLEAAAHTAADAVARTGAGPVSVGGGASVGLAMAEETGGPAGSEDVEALARLREFQDAADLRAYELMEGVVKKRLAEKDKIQEAKAAQAAKEGKELPPYNRAAIERSMWGDLTVAVTYAVDEDGNQHKLITTSKGKYRKYLDLKPDEQWVKAVRGKRQAPEPGAGPVAGPPDSGVGLTEQHEGGSADEATPEAPKRKRTAEGARADAEARLVAHGAKYGLKLVAVGASSYVCPHCAAKLGAAGAVAGTPRAEDPQGEHVPVNIAPALEEIKKLPPRPPRPEPVVEQRRPARLEGTLPGAPPATPSPAPKAPTPTPGPVGAGKEGIQPLQQAQSQPKPEPAQQAPAPQPAKPTAATPTAPQPAKPTAATPTAPQPAKPTAATPTAPQPAKPTPVTPSAPQPAKPAPATPSAPQPAATERKVTSVRPDEVTSRSERTQQSGGATTKNATGTSVTRKEGSLTVTRSKESSQGIFDEEGRLKQGSQSSAQAAAGILAGPEGIGAQGTASAQRTTAYGNGFTTTRSIAGNTSVVVKAARVPGSEPPVYQVKVTITIGASGTLGGGAGGKASASGSLTGSVTGEFVHQFSAEETRRYLGDLDGNGAEGVAKELGVVNLVARGSFADARKLLTLLTSPRSAAEAAKLAEGEEASLETKGGAGVSLTAGTPSLSAEVSFSRSRALKRTVARRQGALFVTVEVVSEAGRTLGASGSSGFVGGGLSFGRTAAETRAVTFRLNPGDPDYQTMFDRVLAVDSAAELAALAAAEPTRVAGKVSGDRSSETRTAKVSLAGLEASVWDSHSYGEKTAVDEAGTRKLFEGGSGGGAGFGIVGGPKLAYQSEQAIAAEVGPDGRAKADVSATTSESDLGAWARGLASAADQTPIGSALKLATGKLLQPFTERVGMKLSDEEYTTIEAVSREPARWSRAFRGFRNSSHQNWQRLGRTIAAGGGDREAMSRALARYADENYGAADAVQAVVRSPGEAEGGIRYDWPAELVEEKETFESIVVGDRIARLRAHAAAGAVEEAEAGLRADDLRLGRAVKAIMTGSKNFTDAAAVAEMLRRIGNRQAEIRAELRKLKAARAQSVTTVPTKEEAAALSAAADAEARQERDTRIEGMISAMSALRKRESAIFAEVREELDHTPWYRKPRIIDVIQKLDALIPLYADWDRQVADLRAVLRQGGEDGSRADACGPDRKTYGELRRHPELRKWTG
ncbi:DUF4157 domain-containing protein [Nonomuraea sp. NPDC046802]|uniref:eCIS core domain-containing protein n=1 Tax=Nonomuraea sp. NPDC046802 TaxID=3154919 RepID=UPI0033D355F4